MLHGSPRVNRTNFASSGHFDLLDEAKIGSVVDECTIESDVIAYPLHRLLQSHLQFRESLMCSTVISHELERYGLLSIIKKLEYCVIC